MPPIIAGLLAQGLNLVANAVLAKGKAYVKEKTGVDLEKGELTRQDLVKLKQYEAEHEEELLKLRLEEDKLNLAEAQLYMADAQNARKREIDIATSEHAPWYNKAITSFLAVITVMLTFGAFTRMTILSDDPPAAYQPLMVAQARLDKLLEEKAPHDQLQAGMRAVESAEKAAMAATAQKATQKEIMLYILGVLSAIASQIYAYYFGSSRGSARKDETIAAFAGTKGE
ncbi:MAG: hypothetical protein ACT4NV_04535 [Rhodoferax sp.]